MATQTGEPAAVTEGGAVVERIRVSVPDRGLRHDVRAISIVWQRELIRFRADRLRAITSLVQPFLFLFILGTGLSNLAGVPYDPVLMLILVGEMLLLAFTLTAFGVMMAARITQFQAFMALTQMLVMPLFFLSGALYPLRGLPAWLSVLTRIDPLTYVVGPMRHAVFVHLSLFPAAVHALSPPITWAGWPVPIMLSLGIVAAMGLGMMFVAIAAFSKTE